MPDAEDSGVSLTPASSVPIAIARFYAKSRTVGAHFGLTPRRWQSGTTVDYGERISKKGDGDDRTERLSRGARKTVRV